MKRVVAILLVALLAGTSLHAQSPLVDAMTLFGAPDADTTWNAIATKYGAIDWKSLSRQSKFLETIVPFAAGYLYVTKAGTAGKLNLPTLVDTAAQFLLTRAQASLADAFLYEMRDLLVKYPELDTLLPGTWAALEAALAGGSSPSGVAAALVGAVPKDIRRLPASILVLKDLQSEDKRAQARVALYQSYFGTHDSDLIELSLLMLEDMLASAPLPVTIHNAGQSARRIAEAKKEGSALLTYLRLLALVSDSCRTSDGAWIDASDQQAALALLSGPNKVDFVKTYLGLLSVQADRQGITVGQARLEQHLLGLYGSAEGFLSKAATDFARLLGVFASVTAVPDLNALSWYNPEKALSNAIALSRYLAVGAESLQAGIWILASSDDATVREAQRLAAMLSSAVDFVVSVARREYAQAFLDLHPLIAHLRSGLLQRKESEVRAVASGVTQVLDGLYRIATFATAASEAQGAEQLTAVLNSFASPVNGYRAKTERSFSVALDALLCGQFTRSTMVSGAASWDSSYGIGTPVGISVSARFGPQSPAFTLLLSGADIGAVTAFRLSGDSADVAYFDAMSILSPGVYLALIVPRTPLALAIGVSLSPGLASVGAGGETEVSAHRVRLALMAGVNVPILYLYRGQSVRPATARRRLRPRRRNGVRSRLGPAVGGFRHA